MSPRALLGALLVSWGISAAAQPRATPTWTEAVDRDAWDGVGYLLTTAQEARVAMGFPQRLDLALLEPKDVVLALAPDDALLQALAAFVEDGGAAVILLEGNASDTALAEFGVRLDPEPQSERYHQEHPGFPVLAAPKTPGGPTTGGTLDPHFVWYNVGEIVLNHPIGLRALSPAPPRTTVTPLVDFSPSPDSAEPAAPPSPSHLVVEVAFGRGRALLVGDSSIAINDMQRHAYGDKQFMANLLRYFCGPDDCEVIGILPDVPRTGAYTPQHGTRFFGLEGVVDRGLIALNDLATATNGTLATPRAAWLTRWILLAAVGAAAIGFAVRLRPRALTVHGPGPPPPSPSALWGRALSRSGEDADFSRPARALARALAATADSPERSALLSELGGAGPVERHRFEQLLARARPLLADSPTAQRPAL